MTRNKIADHNSILPIFAAYMAALGLYLATSAPDVLWGDSAKFQRIAYTGEIESNVFGHPLWVLAAQHLSRLPVRGIAWRATLLAALCGAVTIAFVFTLIRSVVNSRASKWANVAAVAGAGSLTVSHTFWLHSVIAEIYTLNTLITTLSVFFLWKWHQTAQLRTALTWAAGTGLFIGMGMANHLMIATIVPGLACGMLVARKPIQDRGVSILVAAAAALIGWTLALVPVRGASPLSSNGTVEISSVIEGLLDPGIATSVVLFAALIAYQFPGPILLLALPGIRYSWRANPAWTVGLLLACAGTSVWTFTFRVPDQYVFFMITYLVTSVWIGLGMAWLLERWNPTRARLAALGVVALVVMLPIGTYAVAPRLVSGLGLRDILPVRDLPGRDALTFFLWPPKNEASARGYARSALGHAASHGLLLADYTLAEPLRYVQQVEGLRTDVEVVTLDVDRQARFLAAQPHDRALYLAALGQYYAISEIQRSFEIVPDGPLFALKSRRP
jgi:hypothetical protein